jgi:hypothetical protein
MMGSSGEAAQLAASPEGLSSMSEWGENANPASHSKFWWSLGMQFAKNVQANWQEGYASSWQVYQCWCRICREINDFPGSNIICFTFYINLWPIYWLSLVQENFTLKCMTQPHLMLFLKGIQLVQLLTKYRIWSQHTTSSLQWQLNLHRENSRNVKRLWNPATPIELAFPELWAASNYDFKFHIQFCQRRNLVPRTVLLLCAYKDYMWRGGGGSEHNHRH